jgi:hypothetical protein
VVGHVEPWRRVLSNPFDFSRSAGDDDSMNLADNSDFSQSATPMPVKTRPPLQFLLAAAVLAVVACVVAVVFKDSIPLTLAAWFAAGPVSVALVGFFLIRDVVARTGAIYTAPRWVSTAFAGLIVVIAISVVISCWQFADLVSRL